MITKGEAIQSKIEVMLFLLSCGRAEAADDVLDRIYEICDSIDEPTTSE
tara:strand:- start:1832 stop:1978 length:147 start_codon:yes stop_codon:yes gene_type:complete